MRYIFIAHFVIFTTILHAQYRFTAVADAQKIENGSFIKIEFRLNTTDGSSFKAPSFNDFDVVSGPSRSIQTSIINGQMSGSIGYIYTLRAKKVGKFQIGSAQINVGKHTYQTSPIQLEVVKSNSKQSQTQTISGNNQQQLRDNAILIEAKIDEGPYFPAQQIVVNYILYTSVNIGQISVASRPEYKDCYVEGMANLNQQNEQVAYKGKQYIKKVIQRVAIYPMKNGKLEIPAAVYRVEVENNAAQDPFFGGIFNMFNTDVVNIWTNTNSIEINPLPQPIPKQFSGAVGTFAMDIKTDKQQVRKNDALTLRMKISGDGDFNRINIPLWTQDSTIKLYDPKASEIVKDEIDIRMKQSRHFDIIAIPYEEGKMKLTPGFVYFDPAEQKYVFLRDSVEFDVLPALQQSNSNAINTNHVLIRELPNTFSLMQIPFLRHPVLFNLGILSLLGLLLIQLGLFKSWKWKGMNNQKQQILVNKKVYQKKMFDHIEVSKRHIAMKEFLMDSLQEKYQMEFANDVACKNKITSDAMLSENQKTSIFRFFTVHDMLQFSHSSKNELLMQMEQDLAQFVNGLN